MENEKKEAPELTTQQLAEQLAAKELELAAREAAVSRAEEKNAKERLYDKIHISPKALDIFIGICCALIVVSLILGVVS